MKCVLVIVVVCCALFVDACNKIQPIGTPSSGNDVTFTESDKQQAIASYATKTDVTQLEQSLMNKIDSLVRYMQPGRPGATGATGRSGVPGMPGRGVTGIRGQRGPPGNAGRPGSTGATGRSGFRGFTGFTGRPGGTGATGPLGKK